LKISANKVLFLCFFLSFLVLSPLVQGEASFSGSWNSDIDFLPQSSSMISLASTLELSHSDNGRSFSSISTFRKNDFTGQRFSASLSVGYFALDSTLALDLSDVANNYLTEANYWLTDTRFALGGVTHGSTNYI